jgi:hypothetical protein
MLFNEEEHTALSALFTTDYAGYRPTVLEAPNSDGNVDTAKRYLHVSLKYNPPEWAIAYLARAHFEACRIAEALEIPDRYYPKVENGTLRVLDYPPGAGTAVHTDMCMFTVHCYRNTTEDFVRLDPVDPRAEKVDPNVHIGDLGAELGLGLATRHTVPARPYQQKAIIYFAMPGNRAVLPNGEETLVWLADRYAKSRVKTY